MISSAQRRPLLVAYAVVVGILLVAPTLVVIPMGFTSQQSFEFPPPGWSLQWYERFFSDPRWLDAAFLSVQIALVVALSATVLGSIIAFALYRGRRLWSRLGHAAAIAPMTVPGVITAIAMYIFFLRMGLQATFLGYVIAHTVMAIPLVVIPVLAGMAAMDKQLEQAAAGLGASQSRILLSIRIPLLAPSLLTGVLFAFLISFDETIISLFISGPFMRTLPVELYLSVTERVDPTIAVASTMVLIASTLIVLIAGWLATRPKTRMNAGITGV